MKKPRIALVHDFLYIYAGAERVLSSLHELYPDAPIYTAFAEPEIVQANFPKAVIHTTWLQTSWLRKNSALLLMAMQPAVETYDLSSYDVVISSAGAYSHAVITGPQTAHICYCHSPVRYGWDWHSEYMRERGISGGWKLFFAESILSRLRLWDQISALRVDQWIANSATVQGRIKKFYRAESELIFPPVDTTYFDPALVDIAQNKPKKPYAITVGRLSLTKKVDVLIQACAAVGLELWIGGSGPDRDHLEKVAAEAGGSVRFLGRISEEEKRQMLAQASCFLFATEEDFGIAPVEALSLGVPVIALNKGGVTETVVAGKSGQFFAETTTEVIAEALKLFLKEGVAWSPAEIRASAIRFSKENFQEKIQKLVNNWQRE